RSRPKGPTSARTFLVIAAETTAIIHHHSWWIGPTGVVPGRGPRRRRGERRPRRSRVCAMSAVPPPDALTTAPPRLSADHPGINELFALLAYGEIAAFYRLTDEAKMAPDLRGRISMASMAAAEMRHYDLLRDTLERRGV